MLKEKIGGLEKIKKLTLSKIYSNSKFGIAIIGIKNYKQTK